LIHLTAGSIAGALAVLASHPFDLVKTRLQIQKHNMNSNSQVDVKYRSTFTALKLIIREEGWLALKKGMSARLISNVPTSAICFGLFEIIKNVSGLKKSETK